jgi:hypothetical protein
MKKPLLLLAAFALSSLAAALWYGSAHPAFRGAAGPDVRPAIPPEAGPGRVVTADQPDPVPPHIRAAATDAGRLTIRRLETERRVEDTFRQAGLNKPADGPGHEVAEAKPAGTGEGVPAAAPIMYGPDGVRILRVGER